MAIKTQKSRARKASENWMPTGRDTLAATILGGMVDPRTAEVRRKPDRKRLVEAAYTLADDMIEFSLGKA